MADEASNDGWQFGLLDERNEAEPPIESVHEDLDRLFDLLAEPRRRRVLTYLSETAADAVALTDLIAAVVAREPDPEGEIDHYEVVAIDVYHTHLPKLEAAGLLEYDARSRTVRYYGHPKLEEFLALANEYDSGTSKTSRFE